MGNEVESLQQHAHFIEVVSFIHTPTLPFLLCRLWPFDGDTCDRLFHHPEIVSVRSVYGNADRNAFFSEQAPFYPLFCAVSRIWPSFFPPQAVLSPSFHPWNRSSSQCLAIRRISQGTPSRAF